MALPPDPTLSDIRQEIDRIDEEMHRLLMQRGEIIDRLITVKKSQETGSAFRPAREASMMVRLAERHAGKLPVELVAHIWRQIISTFTYIQAPYAVHILSGEAQSETRELARFHFGFSVPLIGHATVRGLIDSVAAERGDLGFLHLGATEGAWWRALGRDGAPMVMASAPAMVRAPKPPLPQAVVIGNTGFDVAGLDRHVVGVTLKETAPLPSSHDVLAQVVEDGRRHLLVWGPVSHSIEAIAQSMKDHATVEEAWLVGYTAKPVSA